MEEQLANDQVEIDTTGTESATVETNDSMEDEGAEKPAQNSETTYEEKMVPLSALQKERQERKALQTYLKSIQSQPSEYENTQTQPDENGYVEIDPNQFMTRDEFIRMERENKEWSKAENDFPIFKEFPELKEQAEALRQAKALKEFRYISPYEAAKMVSKPYLAGLQKGKTQAQESVEIQRNIPNREGSGAKSDTKAERLNELKAQIGSRDKQVSNAALQELLKQI